MYNEKIQAFCVAAAVVSGALAGVTTTGASVTLVGGV